MSANGFLKRGVIRSLDAIGGIAGGMKASGKQHATVGRWHNRNDADLPSLGDALAIDDIALASGGRAEILRALAAELGHAVFQLPDSAEGEDALMARLAEATSEFGDVAQAIVDALRDGRRGARENMAIAIQIDEAIGALVLLRALAVGHGDVRPLSPAAREG